MGSINFLEFFFFFFFSDKNGEKQIASEPHGMVFNVEPVKMTISSEQKKIEIGEIGN